MIINYKSGKKLILRSCEEFSQDPSTYQNPWELPPIPKTQNMATSLRDLSVLQIGTCV